MFSSPKSIRRIDGGISEKILAGVVDAHGLTSTGPALKVLIVLVGDTSATRTWGSAVIFAAGDKDGGEEFAVVGHHEGAAAVPLQGHGRILPSSTSKGFAATVSTGPSTPSGTHTPRQDVGVVLESFSATPPPRSRSYPPRRSDSTLRRRSRRWGEDLRASSSWPCALYWFNTMS